MMVEKNQGVVVNALVALFFTALISVQSWTALKILSHDNWIAATSANRYTIQMAAQNDKENAEKFALIQEQLSEIKLAIARLPESLPPAWFLKDYAEFKLRVNYILGDKSVK